MRIFAILTRKSGLLRYRPMEAAHRFTSKTMRSNNGWQSYGISAEEWVAQYERARTEYANVRKLNLSRIKENARIKERNEVMNGKGHIKRQRLDHKISTESEVIMERETRMRKIMKDRKPEDWAKGVSCLPVGIRGQVARMIWWDFMGDRQVLKRSDALDRFASEPYTDQTEDDLCRGLCAAGYSPWEARKRARGERIDI